MPFARGDMRDHMASRKNDHGARYGRYAVLRRWSQLKMNFCKIFSVVQFSTFATQSGAKRTTLMRRSMTVSDPWLCENVKT